MNDNRTSNEKHQPMQAVKGKKPYQKPSFRHEQVFETMALSCGKITGTLGQCQFSGKTS